MHHQKINLVPAAAKPTEELIRPRLRPRNITAHRGAPQPEPKLPLRRHHILPPQPDRLVDTQIRLLRDLRLIEPQKMLHPHAPLIRRDVHEERIDVFGLRGGADTGDPFDTTILRCAFGAPELPVEEPRECAREVGGVVEGEEGWGWSQGQGRPRFDGWEGEGDGDGWGCCCEDERCWGFGAGVGGWFLDSRSLILDLMLESITAELLR